MSEKVKCPYCGTTAKENTSTRRSACECKRLHEKIDFGGKKYNVLYRKDGTKEIIYGKQNSL